MAYLLRKIRKTRWVTTEDMTWLSDGELPADPLNDLGTQSNELSVYYITASESNLDRVIAALAANADNPSNIDFAVFDEEMIPELGIRIKKSNGMLPDEQVNNWHHDLYELSATKILSLARAIKGKARIDRKMQILNMVADSVIKSQINRSLIKWKNQADLDKLDKLVSERA